jgi:protein-histidine N-methyltransferase
MLPAQVHDLDSLLLFLPSKIAYGVLEVILDDGTEIAIPRRELWDVRVQLMAESDADGDEVGLGKDDVKTGVYEGGFKSWESSVDLVKVLAAKTREGWAVRERRILEVLHIEPPQCPVSVKEV